MKPGRKALANEQSVSAVTSHHACTCGIRHIVSRKYSPMMGRVAQDIFEFWSQIARGEHVHPADRRVFDRIRPVRASEEARCCQIIMDNDSNETLRSVGKDKGKDRAS